MKQIDDIIIENNKRNAQLEKPYNPITGEACYGERVHLHIADAPVPDTYIPVQMAKEPLVAQLLKHRSMAEMYKSHNLELTEHELEQCWIDVCEIRIKYDAEYYFARYETIEDATEEKLIPFVMNPPQREFHRMVMDDLLDDRPVRIVTLKARQHGISTYIQMLFSWVQKIKKKRWNSVVCAHQHDASKNIRSMYSRSMEYMMPIGGIKYEMSNFEGTQNIKELKERGCRIAVGSAEKPDGLRSQNAKLAHFSEVAFYPDTDKKKTGSLIASILGTLKLAPWTVIVHESTANGRGNYFETEYNRAKIGDSAYKAIFLPWFWSPIYIEEFNGEYYNSSGRKEPGTIEEFIATLSEYEKTIFNNNPSCTLEKLNWYRGKAGEMSTPAQMKQEYPSDDVEAFQDSGRPVFRYEDIEKLRPECRLPRSIGTLTSDAPPSIANVERQRRKEILSNIQFREDKEATEVVKGSDSKLINRMTQDKLWIWRHPSSLNIRDRYLVVFDPQRGITDSADWGVISVFDRMPMMSGEAPELVAQFRGHIDKDITIWIAVQIATYYNNALLVVESNTYDSQFRDDDSELIFDTIKDYYPNLYARTEADKVREGAPVKWGFNTNKKTKPLIIANFESILREDGYIERDLRALNEAHMFEVKDNGSTGAKSGQNDDILMTRMIGMYICYTMPLPRVIEESRPVVRRRATSMSDL